MTIHYLFSIRDLGGEHKEETIRADPNPCKFSRELDGQSLTVRALADCPTGLPMIPQSSPRAFQLS